MTSLTILALVVGAVASLTGVLVAISRFLNSVKSRWVEEQKSTDALKANTMAIQQLTQAVQAQSADLTDHERRIKALEEEFRAGN